MVGEIECLVLVNRLPLLLQRRLMNASQTLLDLIYLVVLRNDALEEAFDSIGSSLFFVAAVPTSLAALHSYGALQTPYSLICVCPFAFGFSEQLEVLEEHR